MLGKEAEKRRLEMKSFYLVLAGVFIFFAGILVGIGLTEEFCPADPPYGWGAIFYFPMAFYPAMGILLLVGAGIAIVTAQKLGRHNTGSF